MQAMPRIRRRVEKTLAFAVHATRAVAGRRRLEAAAASSPVARGLLAGIRGEFGADERRAFETIEAHRARLYARSDEIDWSIEDPVEPSAVPPPERQTVGPWARNSSTKPHWGQLIYALVREIRPAICLELGTCFGMSGLYILAAMRHTGAGRLVTMEGSRARSEIAGEAFRQLGHESFERVVGDFDRKLEPTLARLGTVDLAFVDGNHRRDPTLRYDALVRRHAREGGVILHDDIRWSSEMAEAWTEIAARPARRVFDTFRLGAIELGGASAGRGETIVAWLGLDHLR